MLYYIAGKIPAEIKEKYDYIDFVGISSLRNIVIYDYIGIDYDKVFSILKEDIPELDKSLIDILEADYNYKYYQIYSFQKEYNDTRKFKNQSLNQQLKKSSQNSNEKSTSESNLWVLDEFGKCKDKNF